MDFTNELSKAYQIAPFEVLKQDKDYVIMLINYFILKGETTPQPQNANTAKGQNAEERVWVNNRTATGGWW